MSVSSLMGRSHRTSKSFVLAYHHLATDKDIQNSLVSLNIYIPRSLCVLSGPSNLLVDVLYIDFRSMWQSRQIGNIVHIISDMPKWNPDNVSLFLIEPTDEKKN